MPNRTGSKFASNPKGFRHLLPVDICRGESIRLLMLPAWLVCN